MPPSKHRRAMTSAEHGKAALFMRISVGNFRDDPMFRRIARVVADLLAKTNVVTPVDVLIGMGLLRPQHLDDWRFGRCAASLVQVLPNHAAQIEGPDRPLGPVGVAPMGGG